MECSPGYRDGRKVVLECWHVRVAQPIAQRVQQAGQISLKYYYYLPGETVFSLTRSNL
jgi:hypothetical protein